MPTWLLAAALVIGIGTLVASMGVAVSAYRRRQPRPTVPMTLWRGSELLGHVRESPDTGADAESRGGERSKFTGYLIPRAEADIHGVIQSRPFNDARSCTQIPAAPTIVTGVGGNHPPAPTTHVALQPMSTEDVTPLEAQLVLRGENGAEIPAYGIALLESRYEPGTFALMKHGALGDSVDPIPDDVYINGRVWHVSVSFGSPFDLAFRD